MEFSSVYQLIAGLHNPSMDYGADVRVAIHSRFVQPLLDIVLLFLALPLVVRRESRKVFLAIGVCMGVTTMFMLTVIGFQWLGDNQHDQSRRVGRLGAADDFRPGRCGA